MRKNYTRRSQPTSGGWNNQYLFLVLGIFFVLASLALVFFSVAFPWFALLLQFCAKVTFWLGVGCILPSIIKLIKKAKLDLFDTNVNKLDLTVLGTDKFAQQLFNMGLYVKDPYNTLRMRLPKILFTDEGFKITAIGNLKPKLLSDETINEFNAFLQLHNSRSVIRSSYYANGYVWYQVGNSIKSDRLRFR